MGSALFYGGVGVAVLAVVGMIIFLCLFRAKKRRLDAQLEREYGAKQQD